MSKKNRSEKEASKLRREVEILKARLKAVKPEWPVENRAEKAALASGTSQNVQLDYKTYRPAETADFSYLRKDMLKTAILSFISFASIFLIYFYQSKASQILKLFSPILQK